jgi:hypothetical protein
VSLSSSEQKDSVATLSSSWKFCILISFSWTGLSYACLSFSCQLGIQSTQIYWWWNPTNLILRSWQTKPKTVHEDTKLLQVIFQKAKIRKCASDSPSGFSGDMPTERTCTKGYQMLGKSVPIKGIFKQSHLCGRKGSALYDLFVSFWTSD